MRSSEDAGEWLGRRKFLMIGAGAVVLGGCSRLLGIGEVLASTGKTTQPLLSDRSVEEHFPLPSSPEFGRHIEEAKSDLGAYLRKHYHLTKQQVDKIAQLPKPEREEFNRALDTAAKKKLRIHVTCQRSNADFSLRAVVEGSRLLVTAAWQ